MNDAVKEIVILGGGSAGWLTAGVIAAEHKSHLATGLRITLVESPDVATIGVGEGTWPTMRNTLSKMGVNETDVFRECEASFKQGAKFVKWVNGAEDDFYYHPLVIPNGYSEAELVFHWQSLQNTISFADAVCFQGHLCENGRAPKQISTPEYAAIANYAYHLNSGKLGEFLQKHCKQRLGVQHILDHVVGIKSAENGDIEALETKAHGDIHGDLFIDCSGMASLLIGKHFGIPFLEKKGILFNDTAWAVHAPYLHDDSPIASHTISTAQSAGWVWDIGLPTRRGVGYAYSSAHISNEAAADELQKYIEQSVGEEKARALSFRKIRFNPGHREKFWYKNCVAVGMSAGFLEPLEASALVLVELSAAMISDELPATKSVMNIVAKRFNRRFCYRWDSIIDFLKMHYVLTKRVDSDYWIDNVRRESIPERLQELMSLWRHQPPNKHDFPQAEEVFPSASWQYVLYGMGFETQQRSTEKRSNSAALSSQFFKETEQFTQKCLSNLPSNRELINKIYQYGMQRC